MKYIELFETVYPFMGHTTKAPKYKVDDYVLLSDRYLIYPYVKITAYREGVVDNFYYIKGFLLENDRMVIHELPEKYLLRLLTPDEIEEYEARLTAQKYNL